MAITELVLILFIVAHGGFRYLRPIHHAAPQWPHPAVNPLLRRGRVDGMIFRRPDGDSHLQQYCQPRRNNHHRLLSALALMGLYLFWIRTPRILFKKSGFFLLPTCGLNIRGLKR